MNTILVLRERMKFTLVVWVRVFVLMVCAALAAAFAHFEWTTREAILAKAENDALMMAGTLGQHAQDTFEMIDVVITGAATRISTSDRSLADLYAIDEGLADQLRQAWRIRSIMAFDENGRQFISSQPQVQDWFNLSQADAFEYHRRNSDPRLRLGAPVKSPTNEDWIVPVTRRLDKSDGAFDGIIMATIRVNYFTGFYKSLGESSGAIISLLSKEGVLLSRYPLINDMIGRNVARELWKSDVSIKHAGTLRFSSPVDSIDRVYGFRSIEDYPLVIFVGLSRDAVTAAWLRDAIIHLSGAFGLIALFGIAGMKLAKHVGLRQTSQIELMRLSRTDGLTGLMNRRAFDLAFGKAWLSATSMSPVSLLLLDVDHFKAFNDAYGHPAGDTCLQIVAATMTETVYKPADRVARYGGEEFAVLLPDTNEASGLVVAERVRAAIEELRIPHRSSKVRPVLSVSIGVSTYRPSNQGAATIEEFLKDADRALYKAKLLGRNQVQSSRLSVVPKLVEKRPPHPINGTAGSV